MLLLGDINYNLSLGSHEQSLQVKQFSVQQGRELWLDWNLLPNMAAERKLEWLKPDIQRYKNTLQT